MFPLFLAPDHRDGDINLVFVFENPGRVGFRGPVIENVKLDYDIDAVHRWAEGEPAPEACVGQSPVDPNHYKVFKYGKDRDAAGFIPVAGRPLFYGFWKDYLRQFVAEELPEEDWYQQLDRYDEAARMRRGQVELSDEPATKNRDDVAAWIARRHLVTDTAIREVWYLPQEAPPEEIRLLELNDRLGNGESKVEPVDFGLDVEGANFRLVVADVTTEQLAGIRNDPSTLPSGWRLENHRQWKRGA